MAFPKSCFFSWKSDLLVIWDCQVQTLAKNQGHETVEDHLHVVILRFPDLSSRKTSSFRRPGTVVFWTRSIDEPDFNLEVENWRHRREIRRRVRMYWQCAKITHEMTTVWDIIDIYLDREKGNGLPEQSSYSAPTVGHCFCIVLVSKSSEITSYSDPHILKDNSQRNMITGSDVTLQLS